MEAEIWGQKAILQHILFAKYPQLTVFYKLLIISPPVLELSSFTHQVPPVPEYLQSKKNKNKNNPQSTIHTHTQKKCNLHSSFQLQASSSQPPSGHLSHSPIRRNPNCRRRVAGANSITSFASRHVFSPAQSSVQIAAVSTHTYRNIYKKETDGFFFLHISRYCVYWDCRALDELS